MKKLLCMIILIGSLQLHAMEEDKTYEGMISFYEAYLSSKFIYSKGDTAHCSHYLKGSEHPYALTYKSAALYLENAKEQVAKIYEDGKSLQHIENLLKQGYPLNMRGQLTLQLQAVHQFHANADLDDSHKTIKTNRELYKNAWLSKDAVEILLASRLPIYPEGESHIPIMKRIEQLKQELGK